jgi:soluble lytic murein transglycosylase
MRVAGSTTRTEISFLKAFCLEQLGRNDEAFNAYLAIPDGRSEYYGWRASERLKNLANNPKTRDFISARLNLFKQAATQAIAANEFERARVASQNALRLTNEPSVRRELLDIARRAYEKLPDYNRFSNPKSWEPNDQNLLADKSAKKTIADELLFLGLYDEAAPEYAAQPQSSSALQGTKPANPKTDERAFTLAVFFKRGDLAHKAVAYAEPIWRSIPADYLVELAPREIIELMYPVPFARSLLAFAPSREVDPRFVLSIMRQESRYRADVKSSAAARGLMQFIPSTAEQIAAQLNLADFTQEDLYDAPTAVLFGSQYLSNIFREFPQQPQAVAAAYNGGEANMTRWLVRARSIDPDRYVSEIQFSQSKDYVFKVLANYRIYQLLYDEQLRRR